MLFPGSQGKKLFQGSTGLNPAEISSQALLCDFNIPVTRERVFLAEMRAKARLGWLK